MGNLTGGSQSAFWGSGTTNATFRLKAGNFVLLVRWGGLPPVAENGRDQFPVRESLLILCTATKFPDQAN